MVKYEINCLVDGCGWKRIYNQVEYNNFFGVCPLCRSEKLKITIKKFKNETLNNKECNINGTISK